MSEETTSKMGGILGAFAIGALVGAGVALLYAPQSGRETREMLARKSRELKEKVDCCKKSASDDLLDKVS